VRESLFREVEDEIIKFNDQEGIEASQFELLTATAFEIFNRAKVPVAVVEVGMGGLTDANNIITAPLVTVISKISLDHQNLLGSTLQEIAFQKAGIIKDGAPCIVDQNNKTEVLDVIRKQAEEHKAPLVLRKSLTDSLGQDLPASISSRGYQPYQLTNLGLAWEATKIALPALGHTPPKLDILSQLPTSFWPGRLQTIGLDHVVGMPTSALVDGAHNVDAARTLEAKLGRTDKQKAPEKVTWLVAMSNGKNATEILQTLLRDGDNVVTAEFGPVDGMPWVQAMPCDELLSTTQQIAKIQHGLKFGADVLGALKKAASLAEGNRLVITGSLYLLSDVFRLCRDTPR
jgi:dihydrofolate synthase